MISKPRSIKITGQSEKMKLQSKNGKNVWSKNITPKTTNTMPAVKVPTRLPLSILVDTPFLADYEINASNDDYQTDSNLGYKVGHIFYRI